MGWVSDQWDQIRGNLKWDLLKIAGAAMLAGLMALLQGIRHLPVDLLAYGVLFVGSLLAFTWLGRARRSAPDSLASAEPGVPTADKSFFDKMAEEDAEHMSTRLFVINHSARVDLDTSEPYVELTLSIVNASVLHLISDTIEGTVRYWSPLARRLQPLSRSRQIVNPPYISRHAEKKDLILRQFIPLSLTDEAQAQGGKLTLNFGEVIFWFRCNGHRFPLIVDDVDVHFRQR